MTKIIIPNYGNGLNRGAAALLSSRINALKENIPNSEFTVFSFNPELDPGIDKKFIKDNNIKFYEVAFKIRLSPLYFYKTISSIMRVFIWRFVYKFGFEKYVKNKKFKEYSSADFVISIGGDVLTEDYGSISFISHVLNLFYGLIFDVPIIIFAESIGPFKKRINKLIANLFFNKSTLITVREEISKKNLQDIGVNKVPIYVTNDSAFLLQPSPLEHIEEILHENNIIEHEKSIIGISLSKIISYYGFSTTNDKKEKYQLYIQTMAKVIDYLILEFNSIVILIPHVMELPNNDDRIVNKDTFELVHNHKFCYLINNEYSAEELKGLIGVCDIFIGSRMHATIASTSMLVPTIAIAYSHKTHGIIGKLLKQEEYVIDIKDFEYDLIISTINSLWKNREKVKHNLNTEITAVKKKSFLTVELIQNFYCNIDAD